MDDILEIKSEKSMKVVQLNASAMNYLFCALSENIFIEVSMCKSTKDIWESSSSSIKNLIKIMSPRKMKGLLYGVIIIGVVAKVLKIKNA